MRRFQEIEGEADVNRTGAAGHREPKRPFHVALEL